MGTRITGQINIKSDIRYSSHPLFTLVNCGFVVLFPMFPFMKFPPRQLVMNVLNNAFNRVVAGKTKVFSIPS